MCKYCRTQVSFLVIFILLLQKGNYIIYLFEFYLKIGSEIVYTVVYNNIGDSKIM